MTSVGKKKSISFNKNANPFIPEYSPCYFIRIENLPGVGHQEVLDLIDSVISTELDSDYNWDLVQFGYGTAIIQGFDWNFCRKLVELLNGYEWDNHWLEVVLTTDNFKQKWHQPYEYEPRNFVPVPPPLEAFKKSVEKKSEPTESPEIDENNPPNPCRLFIGNIPFTSTWTSLRHFLISKSNELDSSKKVSILRVEIPMLLNYEDRPTSRGFAIVTTGNKESSDLLIKNFDNVEFEGRSLTVRYDKFPDYNNYVLQRANSDPNTSIHNLARERNFLANSLDRNFNQKLYFQLPPGPYVPWNGPMYHPYTMPVLTPPAYSSYPAKQVVLPASIPQKPDFYREKPDMPPVNEDLSDEEKARELVDSISKMGL